MFHGDSGVLLYINSHTIKYITDGLQKDSIGLYTHIKRVNKLLSWDIMIFLNAMRGIPDFIL